ncbi:MAG: hypothetical protein GW949_02430 [Spirochaetales bacterium]|nr:hypothetical protein [Spirochaetales bacterium]
MGQASPINIGIDYSDEFLVGHPVIDREHRSLFEKSRAVLHAFLLNSPRPQIIEGMRELYTELQNHFTHEEAILDALDYPRLPEQREQHEAIMAKAARTLAHYEAQSMSFGDLYSFLFGQIVKGHFLKEDMLLKDFLATSHS